MATQEKSGSITTQYEKKSSADGNIKQRVARSGFGVTKIKKEKSTA